MVCLRIPCRVSPHGHHRQRLSHRIQRPRQLRDLELPIHQLGLKANILQTDTVFAQPAGKALAAQPGDDGGDGDVERAEGGHGVLGDGAGREDGDERRNDYLAEEEDGNRACREQIKGCRVRLGAEDHVIATWTWGAEEGA